MSSYKTHLVGNSTVACECG